MCSRIQASSFFMESRLTKRGMRGSKSFSVRSNRMKKFFTRLPAVNLSRCLRVSGFCRNSSSTPRPGAGLRVGRWAKISNRGMMTQRDQ